MYIVKFLVVKTVGLPSSTAVLSQVQWWSVWLMVRCGPCSLRGPPAAATVAHVGTSLIPFANQRTPSSLLKRYWSFLQNPKKKDKEGPDKLLEIGREVPEGTMDILLLIFISIDLPPLLAIQWSLLILPWHLFKWQKIHHLDFIAAWLWKTIKIINFETHLTWILYFNLVPWCLCNLGGSHLISVSSCVKAICKLLGGNDNQINVIWKASVLFEQVLFSSLWIMWPLDQ